MTDFIIAKLGIYAGIFVVGIISGLVPFVPAEVAIAAVVILVGNFPLAIAIGILVAGGQMVAKLLLYKGAQRAAQLAGDQPDSKLAKAKKWLDRWKDKPLALTFISASVGIPPFYVISLLAGMLGIRFRAFMALGLAGRSIRFVTVALIALYAST